MSEKKLEKAVFNPFGGHVIAMKDVKDKTTTRKGSLRPLFDCIESINSAVDALQGFSETSPDDSDIAFVGKCLELLTNMQIKLLERSKNKIQEQNMFQRAPSQGEEILPEDGGSMSPEKTGGEIL